MTLATRAAFVLVALCAGTALAQSSAPAPAPAPPVTLKGSWSAMGGRHQSFEGTWSAKVEADNPDAASGEWTLLGPGGRVAMQGRWSAQKAAKAWTGIWFANLPGGVVLSGTWQADAKRVAGKTFEDMLRHTGKARVTGSWRAGPASGTWRLAR